jgi:hypothetical protein
MPLFRLAWIPVLVNVLIDFKSTAWFVVFLVLGGCSLVE